MRRLASLVVAIGIGAANIGGLQPPSRSAPAEGSLFSGDGIVEATLEAPFDELFAKSRRDPQATVIGTLRHAGTAIDNVEVSVRGNTSKAGTECSFPKLKVRLPASVHDTSIFKGIRTLKIGTHCGELPDGQLTSRFGRWANEKSPLREAFVYRLLETVKVPALKARPARITYVDGARTVVRNALFLEDDREAMVRLGASRLVAPDEFGDAARDFTADDTANLAFGEALIGNFDWCLKFSPDDTYRCDAHRPLWNVLAYARVDGQMMPVLDDFDIAGMVTGRHLWFTKVFYDGFSASKSPAEIEVVSQVQHTRNLFPRAELDATRQRFMARKSAVYDAVAAADLDAGGRKTIHAYLDSFYAAIATDAAFYVPVVTQPDTAVYLDPGGTRPACGKDSTAPIGTPVGQPLAFDGDMEHVAVLDALWHWAPPARCDPIHTGPIWIDRRAIGTDFPVR